MRRSHGSGFLSPQAGARRDHGRSTVVDSVDYLARVDSLEIDRRDAKMRMSELTLDDRQRDPLVCHLDRMRVSELVRREPTSHTGPYSEPSQLPSDGCCRPATAAGWPCQDAEQRTDREFDPVLGPAGDVIPRSR
jgi:hypothetical protein